MNPFGTGSNTLTFGGLQRTYLVFVPPSYRNTNASSLVLFFHGGGGSGQQAQQSYGWDATAAANNFIVAYPDGTGVLKTWNGGGCCGSAVSNNVDDVGFVGALISSLKNSLCIDTDRVFVAGHSNGGILSQRLACELSTVVAAAAPSAGPLFVSPCTPVRAVPMLYMQALEDLNVPYNGGPGCGPTNGVLFPSVAEVATARIVQNGCSCSFGNSSCRRTLSSGVWGACQTFGSCTTPFVLCSLAAPAGHVWPGSGPGAGVVAGCNSNASSFNLNNADVWGFFANVSSRVPVGGAAVAAVAPGFVLFACALLLCFQ